MRYSEGCQVDFLALFNGRLVMVEIMGRVPGGTDVRLMWADSVEDAESILEQAGIDVNTGLPRREGLTYVEHGEYTQLLTKLDPFHKVNEKVTSVYIQKTTPVGAGLLFKQEPVTDEMPPLHIYVIKVDTVHKSLGVNYSSNAQVTVQAFSVEDAYAKALRLLVGVERRDSSGMSVVAVIENGVDVQVAGHVLFPPS